jgi:hypothetical protein
MLLSPISPISAVAFALPSLSAAFTTPIFTPAVTIALLIECGFWVSACALLSKFSRPLSAGQLGRRPNADAAPRVFRPSGVQPVLDDQFSCGFPQSAPISPDLMTPIADSEMQLRNRHGE